MCTTILPRAGSLILSLFLPVENQSVIHWDSQCPWWMSGRSLVYWVGVVVTTYALGQAVEEEPLT